MTLADRIQQLRKQKGISQEELADRVGVSRQAVSKWETGESTPELSKVVLLARAFRITTDQLLSPEPPQTSAPSSPPSAPGAKYQAIPLLGRMVRRWGWLAGVYLLVYALWQLMDLLGVLINRNVESSRLLSRLRVHPPVLLTALLPSVVLRRLSARYATLTQDVVIPKPSPARESWPETLEVVFHLGKNVAFGFGHVVVSLRGVTYSYGCYDESSNRLFGALSDGVILVSPTESYIPYCQAIEHKLLIGFTLGLSEEAAGALEGGMRARLKSDCAPWTPPDRPEYDFGARFYKVRRGVFRLYNVMRTNCCAIAQIIASGTGLNLLPPNGFVTPGAYFEYLESELRDPESNVLEMRIYAHR